MEDIMPFTTPTVTAPADYLRVSDLDEAQFAALLDLASAMKHDPGGWRGALPWQSVACYFEKPSTRTRVSFAAAAHRLGMHPQVLRPDELQLGRGETIADTARTLAGFCAAIVMRTYAQATIDEVADHSSVPVINALTDDHHPCQALADFLTLRETFGRLDGLRLAYIGDSDNVARSLMEAGALTGTEVVVASPVAYEPEALEMRAVSEFVDGHHGHVSVVHDPFDAVAGAHAVYTDVWVSMGDEADAERRMQELRPYQVTAELMLAAEPQAVFMHCLPAHRGQEVAAEVIDGPSSVVWAQAANRLPTEQAVLYSTIAGRFDRP
jgi:ornithine carbamoyltransferase